jgi:alkanesulfonate monooxygenase SsuD/methylene tetrahydromethanopterin reductase-like flavin-dependent oxidoreductase (luciferase family)
VFAAWQDRIAEDLRHETTHGYVHAVVPAVPLWLDEGIAEFFETPRTERGLHRGHAAHLAGRMLVGTWRADVERLEAVLAAGELTQDHYAEAWCWVHWLLRTTPERRALLQDYLADVRRDPATPPLSARIRHQLPAGGDAAEDLKRHVAAAAALPADH